MWAGSRRTSHNVGSSSEREVAMAAEVHCLCRHFSATYQKGVSSGFLSSAIFLAVMAQTVGRAAGTALSSLWPQPSAERAPWDHSSGTCERAFIHSASLYKADKMNNKQNNSSAVRAVPLSRTHREGRQEVILVKWKANKGLNTTLQFFLTQAQVNKKQKRQDRDKTELNVLLASAVSICFVLRRILLDFFFR